MNLEFIKPQNLGSLLMKSSQSNFNLRSPGSYLVRSYLITTVQFKGKQFANSLSELKILTWALPCSRVCRKEPNGKMQLISFLVKGSISFYLYCCIYVTARSSRCAISKQRNIFESLVCSCRSFRIPPLHSFS